LCIQNAAADETELLTWPNVLQAASTAAMSLLGFKILIPLSSPDNGLQQWIIDSVLRHAHLALYC
jgi:hypothetical protein